MTKKTAKATDLSAEYAAAVVEAYRDSERQAWEAYAEAKKELRRMADLEEQINAALLPQSCECPGCGEAIEGKPFIEEGDMVVCQNEKCDVTYIVASVVTYAVADSWYEKDDPPPFSTFKAGTKESQVDLSQGETS